MNAISEQIQEPEPGAEMADSRSVVGAIADGSQAIAHDGFDVETFEQAADDYARLARTVEETTGAIRTGSALLRDLFWSFHKRSPRVAPVAPLSPAHEINREIIEQIFSTTEWREMRESGTVGDPLSRAMATIGCAASAVAALDKETIRYLNQLHELTGEVEQLFARAETLDELAALSVDKERSEWLKNEAARARTGAAKKEKRAERLSRKLEESSEERQQNVRRTVRQGLAEAMTEVGQANDAINAFGGGYDADFGTENGAGGRNSLSTKEKLVIAQHVGHSPELQQIAAVCGRFTRIALQQQKTRVKHPPDEITSITTGSEIERLLPSEIALLADPDLEDLFYFRFAELGLMQYDMIGHEPEGQGPIIIAIDESGSMTTDYGGMTGEVWSKAVTLALLSIARLQKRDLEVIHFSGPNDLRVDLFSKGQATPAEVIACAGFFFNGGTVFEPLMEKALELVDGSQFEKADVICISDGISDVSPEAQAEWTRRRAELGMRSYGVLIGSNQGEALLGEISDAVFRLDDLRGDLPALEVIFSAV
ncbi:MAG TPA: hypothetical protein VFV58_20615 [Blastocatellia bacterium]|jgi:uncharacterized protein with von Willebrand factor type A (vWA) domain|nr:hypothetical protein [Blastocatellia bacterium]